VPSIATAVAAGQTQVVVVQLQALTTLQNVSLSTDPAGTFISISPARFSRLASGDLKEIRISFSVPGGPAYHLDNITGLIVAKASAETLSATLPFTFAILSQDDIVEGNDTDGNGIWDYIDAYIAANFPEPPRKRAAQQIAVAMQSSLLQANDRSAALQNASNLDRGVECLWSYDGETGVRTIESLKAAILNNTARSMVYLTFGEQLAGSTAPAASDERASCN
jgi:hypothetical protein